MLFLDTKKPFMTEMKGHSRSSSMYSHREIVWTFCHRPEK